MEGLTVAEVSKILRRFSNEHFKRFMGHPLKVRMEIIKKLAEKGKQ